MAKAGGTSLPKTKKYIPRSGPSPAPAPGDIITELKMQVGHPISKCHHAAKDNVDNFLLKGDSRQGLHLPDPSGFSRSDCQLSDFHRIFFKMTKIRAGLTGRGALGGAALSPRALLPERQQPAQVREKHNFEGGVGALSD